MAANATGGSGGESAYNSQVVTLQENAETGVQPFVEVTYTSATQGGGQTQTIKTTISGSQTKINDNSNLILLVFKQFVV